MKKKNYLLISLFLSIFIYSCAGYKPIYNSSNFGFEITKYEIKGEKKLGREIYYRLYNLSKSNKSLDKKSLKILIHVSKNKSSTGKDSAGKILGYRIDLNSKLIVNSYLTDELLLNYDFNYSLNYKVQDQFSETIKLENKTVENLINKTYQDFLVKLVDDI